VKFIVVVCVCLCVCSRCFTRSVRTKFSSEINPSQLAFLGRVCDFFSNVEMSSSRFRYRSRDTLQDPEIILLASIPDLFVAVDGNAGIESEFHSSYAIPRHVPIDGGVFGSFIALGYPEVFPWRINQMYFRELPP
jgi:hypothetical protein